MKGEDRGGGQEPPQESRRRVKSSRGAEGSHGSPRPAQSPRGAWLYNEHYVRTPVTLGFSETLSHLSVKDTATKS